MINTQPETVSQIIDKAEQVLFNKILTSTTHVLHHRLPPIKTSHYNIRVRGHNRELPSKTNLQSKNYLFRMLYSLCNY